MSGVKYAVGDHDKGIYLVEYGTHRIPMFATPERAVTFESISEAYNARDVVLQQFSAPPSCELRVLRLTTIVQVEPVEFSTAHRRS